MLGFLRKFQRPIAFFVFVVVAGSFIFSGRVLNYGSSKSIQTVQINGLKTDLYEVYGLVTLLNFFGQFGSVTNDNVLAKDFFDVGLSEKIFGKYKDLISSHIIDSVSKELKWKLYVNPKCEYFSLENTLQTNSPQLLSALNNFKLSAGKESLDSDELFKKKLPLFYMSSFYDPDGTKISLINQFNQMGEDFFDPGIWDSEFSIFGHDKVSSWLGNEFLHLSAHFIIACANECKKIGIYVDDEYVKMDLLQRCDFFAKYWSSINRSNISKEFVYSVIVKNMGGSEKLLLSSWKNVMLYKEFSLNGLDGFLLDNSVNKCFAQFVCDGYNLNIFAFKDLFINSIEDRRLFEVYGSYIDPNWKNHNTMKQYKLEDINFETLPEELKVRKLKGKYFVLESFDLKSVFSPAELIDWQISDIGWQTVVKHSSALSMNEDDRIDALCGLHNFDQEIVNRECLIEMSNLYKDTVIEYLNARLEKEEEKSFEIGISHSDVSVIKEKSRFVELIDKAIGKDEDSIKELLCFKDGENFVALQISSYDGTSVLTFNKSKSCGALPKLLDQVTGNKNTNKEAFWKKWFKNSVPSSSDELNQRQINFISGIDLDDIDQFVSDKDDDSFESQWKLEKSSKVGFINDKSTLIPSSIDFDKIEIGKWYGPVLSNERSILVFKAIDKVDPRSVFPPSLISSAMSTYNDILNSFRKQKLCEYFDRIEEIDIGYLKTEEKNS